MSFRRSSTSFTTTPFEVLCLLALGGAIGRLAVEAFNQLSVRQELHLYAALAEKERRLISERTKAAWQRGARLVVMSRCIPFARILRPNGSRHCESRGHCTTSCTCCSCRGYGGLQQQGEEGGDGDQVSDGAHFKHGAEPESCGQDRHCRSTDHREATIDAPRPRRTCAPCRGTRASPCRLPWEIP